MLFELHAFAPRLQPNRPRTSLSGQARPLTRRTGGALSHARHFCELVNSIAAAATDADIVRLAGVLIQPIAADGVASPIGRVDPWARR